ncbi:hypothetical protein [Variovorax sp. 38R]|uniref:hypothetical protein n=1 Tax=Variovorax sp. 38R TaxID=2774875 RepID=UPI00177C2F46|nr:hypothetical protein [Variovorax sp. 38R]QOF77564.1 hypothetical protein IG196_24960 [Variovorax sp. 38R]
MSRTKQNNIFFHQESGFSSAFIDVVKVRVPIKHAPLLEMATSNPNIVRVYDRYFVKSRFTDVRAEIWSDPGESSLIIEASLPMYLTGQRAFGILDVRRGCFELSKEVLDRAGCSAVEEFDHLDLLKLECVLRIGCNSDAELLALSTSMRHFAITCQRDQGCSGLWDAARNALGLPHHAQLGYELPQGLPLNSDGLHASLCRDLVQAVEKSLHFSLVIGGGSICRLEVGDHCADDRAILTEAQMQEAAQQLLDSIASVGRKVPFSEPVKGLSETLQLRFKLWSLGDPYAFYLPSGARTRHRATILEAVGVDINDAGHWVDRRTAVRTAADVVSGRGSVLARSELWGVLGQG